MALQILSRLLAAIYTFPMISKVLSIVLRGWAW
jgi:hypothetical protein